MAGTSTSSTSSPMPTEASSSGYITTIGLEVHAQLLTESKMFCACSADVAYAPPNSHVCPVCLGLPGTLPVINAEAVRKTVLTGLALNCNIPPFSKFDRKNYHYPDLMKGYQISQYDLPLCVDGFLEVDVLSERGEVERNFRVGIRRVHLEEDTARLLHRADANGAPYALMDVNRSGVPLMEIVSEPDITSPEEAQLYLTQLRHLLRWIGVSTGNMEEGSFRVDANVSVRPAGQEEYGTRAEVKNMNSFKAVRSALEYEVERQVAILESGGKVVQETRGWVEDRGVTVSQRSKEEAHDYRYFPEPDLPPLTFSDDDIEAVQAELPELPAVRCKRLMEQYDISSYQAIQLTSWREYADIFEKAAYSLSKEEIRVVAVIMVNLVNDWANPISDQLHLIKRTIDALVSDRNEYLHYFVEAISKFVNAFSQDQLREIVLGITESVSSKPSGQLGDFSKLLALVNNNAATQTSNIPNVITSFVASRNADQLRELGQEIAMFCENRAAEQLAEIASLTTKGTINVKIARAVFPLLLSTGRSPREVVAEQGLAVVRDESALEKAADDAIAGNPKAVADYLGGKEAAVAALVGAVMKATRGQADANTAREVLKRKLDVKRDA